MKIHITTLSYVLWKKRKNNPSVVEGITLAAPQVRKSSDWGGQFYERPTMAKRYYSGSYEGRVDSERTQKHDGSMISEDRSAIANMPQNVIMKDWSDKETYMPEDIDDTIRGIDEQIREDNGKRSKHLSPRKA